jgi:hypothetical protein
VDLLKRTFPDRIEPEEEDPAKRFKLNSGAAVKVEKVEEGKKNSEEQEI